MRGGRHRGFFGSFRIPVVGDGYLKGPVGLKLPGGNDDIELVVGHPGAPDGEVVLRPRPQHGPVVALPPGHGHLHGDVLGAGGGVHSGEAGGDRNFLGPGLLHHPHGGQLQFQAGVGVGYRQGNGGGFPQK